MKSHKFVYNGKNQFDRNCFDVKCQKTKGKFCTTIWDAGKYPRNKCKCCKERIK